MWSARIDRDMQTSSIQGHGQRETKKGLSQCSEDEIDEIDRLQRQISVLGINLQSHAQAQMDRIDNLSQQVDVLLVNRAVDDKKDESKLPDVKDDLREESKDKDHAKNYFVRCIRAVCDDLIGTGPRRVIPDPPDSARMRRIVSRVKDGLPHAKPLVPDWEGKRSNIYNSCIRSVFVRTFLLREKGGLFGIKKIPAQYLNEKAVQLAVNEHVFDRLKKRWMTAKRGDEGQVVNSKSSKARELRRRRLFRNRRSACSRDSRYRAYLPLLDDIGHQGMSSDEEEPRKGSRARFVVIDKPWRSARLKLFFSELDEIHFRSLRQTRNARLRIISPDGKSNLHSVVPRELPEDCYSGTFLQGLTIPERIALAPLQKRAF